MYREPEPRPSPSRRPPLPSRFPFPPSNPREAISTSSYLVSTIIELSSLTKTYVNVYADCISELPPSTVPNTVFTVCGTQTSFTDRHVRLASQRIPSLRLRIGRLVGWERRSDIRQYRGDHQLHPDDRSPSMASRCKDHGRGDIPRIHPACGPLHQPRRITNQQPSRTHERTRICRKKQGTYRDTEVISDDPLFTTLNAWYAVGVIRVILVESLIHEDISVQLQQVPTPSIFNPASSLINPAGSSFIVRVAKFPGSVVIAVWVFLSDIDVELEAISTTLLVKDIKGWIWGLHRCRGDRGRYPLDHCGNKGYHRESKDHQTSGVAFQPSQTRQC